MNYGHALTQIHYHEFIPEFNEEYKQRNVNWDQIYEKIKDMVKELFVGVEMKYPEMHAKNVIFVVVNELYYPFRKRFWPALNEIDKDRKSVV